MAVDGQWFRSFYKIYPPDIHSAIFVNKALVQALGTTVRCDGVHLLEVSCKKTVHSE